MRTLQPANRGRAGVSGVRRACTSILPLNCPLAIKHSYDTHRQAPSGGHCTHQTSALTLDQLAASGRALSVIMFGDQRVCEESTIEEHCPYRTETGGPVPPPPPSMTVGRRSGGLYRTARTTAG